MGQHSQRGGKEGVILKAASSLAKSFLNRPRIQRMKRAPGDEMRPWPAKL